MDKVFFTKGINKLHPCLCNICLEARDKELKRARGKAKQEIKKMIEGYSCGKHKRLLKKLENL